MLDVSNVKRGDGPPDFVGKKPVAGGVAGDRLRSIVERIERLEEEKAALLADIRDVYCEAKTTGFDVKILRQVVRLRKLDTSDREEQEEILDLYKLALNM